jgi:hypothetical protein
MGSFAVVKPYVFVDVLESLVTFSLIRSKPTLNLPVCLRVVSSSYDMAHACLFKSQLELTFALLLFANLIGIEVWSTISYDRIGNPCSKRIRYRQCNVFLVVAPSYNPYPTIKRLWSSIKAMRSFPVLGQRDQSV